MRLYLWFPVMLFFQFAISAQNKDTLSLKVKKAATAKPIFQAGIPGYVNKLQIPLNALILSDSIVVLKTTKTSFSYLRIKQMSVEILTEGALHEYNFTSNKFSKELKLVFSLVKPNSKVYFSNLIAIDTDGTELNLGSFYYMVKK